MVEEHLLWCLHCVHREEESCAAFGRKKAAHMNHISTEDLERFLSGRVSDALAVTGIEQPPHAPGRYLRLNNRTRQSQGTNVAFAGPAPRRLRLLLGC
jgi:hypothetical protein